MEKKPVSHIASGLIVGGALIIYSLILNFMDLSTNQALSYVNYIILCVGIIYFVTAYGKSVDHTASFGKLFSFGFKACAVATILVLVFQVIFFLIFPEYKEKVLDMSREQMQKQGAMSEEQIEQALGMVRKFFWVGLIGGTLVFFMIVGAIASLIGAGITKKKPQSPFQPQA